jgi:hypothetical protein
MQKLSSELLRSSLEKEGWCILKNFLSQDSLNVMMEWIQKACGTAHENPDLEAEYEENSGDRKVVRKVRRLFWNDVDFWH